MWQLFGLRTTDYTLYSSLFLQENYKINEKSISNVNVSSWRKKESVLAAD